MGTIGKWKKRIIQMDKHEKKGVSLMMMPLVFEERISKMVFKNLVMDDIQKVLEHIGYDVCSFKMFHLGNEIYEKLCSLKYKKMLLNRLDFHVRNARDMNDAILKKENIVLRGDEEKFYHEEMEKIYIKNIELARECISMGNFSKISKLAAQ